MNAYTTNTNSVPKFYMSYNILNNGSGNYHNYNFWLYLGTDNTGNCYYKVNGTATFVYDGGKYASTVESLYNIAPAILYNTSNSNILNKNTVK